MATRFLDRFRRAPRRAPLRQDKRAAVALMVGVMSPAFLGMGALIVDSGFWYIGSIRLQVAADAGAMGAAFLLSNTTVRSQDSTTQTNTFRTAATTEVNGAATKLAGTINTPTVAWDTTGYTWARVTLTSQMPSYMLGIFNITAPVIRATATATVRPATSSPCVLTLGTTGIGIQVDNSGTVTAANCAIGSNSAGTPSIYLNSGTINANTISAVGTITQSNSGSNNMTATTTTSYGNATTDPNASKTIPTAGSCNVTNGNYTAYSATPYAFAPTTTGGSYVFCGNTTIGGNSSTQTFAPGTYFVVNGDLTFNNASITTATDVTFVLTGTSPGNFSWTNYSNTSTSISAPTTGATAGIAIWQKCNSSGGQTSSFQGGSTLLVSGSMYMPCSNVDVGNNAQLTAPLNKWFNLISKSMYVHGSGAVRTVPGSSNTSSAASVVLTQ